MVRSRRIYLEGKFGQIHARICEPENPTDRPLYCAHQSPKCGAEFDAFMQEAASDRIVVAPDYPGYGMSDPPRHETQATIPAYAESLWQVADQLGHDRIDVFGNHTGGKVAAEMALQYPDRVGGIVMVSAAILTDEERSAFSDFFQPIPLDEAGSRFLTMWERIVERRGPGTTLEMLAKSFAMNLSGGEAYEWGHHAAFAYGAPFEEALRVLPHRITVLNPKDDLTQSTRRAQGMIRNGEVIELPDWGYNFMDVWPSEAAALVRTHLQA